MNLLAAKIYYDGSNWIAIPHTERPYRQRRRRKQPEKSDELQQFEKAFTKSKGKRKNRKGILKTAKKELQIKRKRTEELSRLMQIAYEDRLKGKMPEDICISFIQKYSDEQKRLETEIAELEEKLTETTNTIQSADEFIRNIKKYLEAPELTREMCYELLDRVVVGGHPKHTGKERVIDIVYKVDIASVLRYKFNK